MNEQTKHKISLVTSVEIQIVLPYETLTTSVSSESLICDTIIINGGYLGIISFGLVILSLVAVIIYLSLVFGTLLSSTLKELKL